MEEEKLEVLTIGGVRIDVRMLNDPNVKMRDFLEPTMKKLLENDLIPDFELKRLCEEEYSKRTFSTSYALLTKDCNANSKNYWRDEVAKGYYLCNEWKNLSNEVDTNQEKARSQRDKFYNWLLSLSDNERGGVAKVKKTEL